MSSRSPNARTALQRKPFAGSRLRPLRFLARLLLGLVGAAWAVLLVGWLSLHWLILPHIEDWRVPIEGQASRMLGAPVKIGAIEVRSSGWVPAIELRDVRILDAEQRVALTLPHVFAAFSTHSLLTFEPRFEQLLIDAPSLDIRRDAAGHISVAGLDFGSNAAGAEGDSAAANWFFKQNEFVIRNGTLRWIDDQRGAPPLALSGVDMVVRNGLRSHALRIDATPPAEWGDRFSVRGRFQQPLFARAGDWQHWSGSVYAELPRADVRELRRHVDLPFELSEGDGALRGWFDVNDGRPEGATVDVLLHAVTLRLDKSVEPLAFEHIEGRFDAERKGDRTAIGLQGFGFVTGDGIRWPKGDLAVAWRQPEGKDVDSGEFKAERLDVGLIAGIATRVPLGAALRSLLADVHPQGVITKLSTRWDGPLDAPVHYRVSGTLSGLSLTARAAPQADAVGRPGLRNATVELVATEAGGEARVGVKNGALDLPGVFADPAVLLDRLDAKLAWKIETPAGNAAAPKITVRVSGARFANADAEGELRATWRTGDGTGMARGGRYPGELELDGSLANGVAGRTARYLPLGLPESVRSYVGRAVGGGLISSASFRVRGDLHDFPFHNAKSSRDGEFRIAAKVDDLTFDYVPAPAGQAPGPQVAGRDTAGTTWPALTGVSGELVIDRTSLEVKNGQARLAGVDWSRVHAVIAQLGEHPRLDLDGNARGALADMLRYVNVTPIGRWTGRALAAATGSGAADLKLALSIPLDDPGRAHVNGSLGLLGNDIRMTPDTPLLANAKGRVDFTQSSFAVVGANARVLGGELSFDGGSQGNAQRFSGQGTITAEALRHAAELGSLARLGTSLNGQMSYRATLAFVDGHAQIGVTSNLVGLGVDLPEPLGKAAAAPLALRVQTALDDAARADEALRETLHVDVGDVLQARFVREAKGEESRVVRGAIRVLDPGSPEAAEPLVLPAAGVVATVALKRLNVDAWEAAANRLGVQTGSASGTAAPLVFDSAGGMGYVPDSIALRVGELANGSRRLTNLTAGLSQDNGLWRANVDATELDGYLEYRPARRGGGGAGGVYARLSRLSLPKGEAERVESLLEEQPTSVPGARHRRRRLRAARQASRPSRGRSIEPCRRRSRRGARMAVVEAEPGHAGGPARGQRNLGRRGRRGGDVATRRGDEFHADPGRQRRPARTPGHGQGRARRQGFAFGQRLVAGLAAVAGHDAHDRAGQGGHRLRPVPEGRAGRGTPLQRAQPAVADAPPVARLPRSRRRGFRLRQRRRRRRYRPWRGDDEQFADARRRRRRADGGLGRSRARNREPARRRGSRDQCRHGLAGLRHHQSGDRPRHLSRTILPAQAADGGEHERVSRRRRVGRSEGRTHRAIGVRCHGGTRAARRRRRRHCHRHRSTAHPMKIAALQMISTPSVERNLETARALVERAAGEGVELAVLPEYFCLMGRSDRDKLAVAEPFGSGPIQSMLADAARRHRLWLVGGTLPLASGQADRVMNSSLVFSPTGECVARYDKIHLFRYDNGREQYDEGRTLSPGSTPTAFAAGEWRVGQSICYDLRFPELYRALMRPPCDLICVPSAFTYPTGAAHWEVLLRARAIENQCYVIAAAQGGRHENGRRTFGHSIVIDPWGEVLAVLPEGEGMVSAELKRERIAEVRTQLPALEHRRSL